MAVARSDAQPVADPVVLEATEARSMLGRILDEELSEVRVRTMVRSLMEAAGESPDAAMKAARALDKLLSQAKGTPKQTHSVEMNMKVSAARTVAELEQLSDEELALVAAGAATRALPAAAE